jgi:hypothetical protein
MIFGIFLAIRMPKGNAQAVYQPFHNDALSKIYLQGLLGYTTVQFQAGSSPMINLRGEGKTAGSQPPRVSSPSMPKMGVRTS